MIGVYKLISRLVKPHLCFISYPTYINVEKLIEA